MYKISCIILLLFTAGTTIIMAQEAWELKEDKNGIAVYSRSSDYSNFNEFRAVTQIDQSIHSFVAVLRDIDRIPDWMHSVKSSRLLERSGDSIQVYYTEAKAPFPLKNRDGVYLNRFIWNPASKTLRVDIEVHADYLEEEDNLVRISKGKGFWEAKDMGSGTLVLTFQMQVDPGGSIPSWAANMFVVDTPFQTLTKLKQIIDEEQYARAKYDFIDE